MHGHGMEMILLFRENLFLALKVVVKGIRLYNAADLFYLILSVGLG